MARTWRDLINDYNTNDSIGILLRISIMYRLMDDSAWLVGFRSLDICSYEYNVSLTENNSNNAYVAIGRVANDSSVVRCLK